MEAIKGFWENGFWGIDPVMLRMTAHTLLRLAAAVALGGVIGFERQHSHRPAGLRTHILVTVGSALVMCTSEYIQLRYYGGPGSGPDISRMGAQVISGIGFLGAGTILRKGTSVEGLTTAASLWAVACIGLAVGIGFWAGALAGTALLYITLNSMKKVNRRFTHIRQIFIGVDDEHHVSEQATEVFRACGAKLRRLEIIFPEDADGDVNKVLRALAYINSEGDLALIKKRILSIEGVRDFNVE